MTGYSKWAPVFFPAHFPKLFVTSFVLCHLSIYKQMAWKLNHNPMNSSEENSELPMFTSNTN